MEWTNFMKLWVYLGKKKEYGHVTRFYICKHLDRATGLCPIYHTGRPRVCTGFKSEANTCGNTCTSFKCKENIIKKSNVPKRIKDLNKRSLKMEIGINA